MKKRATLMLFILIIFFTSCKSQVQTSTLSSTQQEIVSNAPFVLATLSGEDLHPLLCKSNTNRELLRLCYDGLIKLNSSFEPQPMLADFKISDNTALFTIKPNAKFSDGSLVTAEDVIYSYNIAAQSESVYSPRFRYITSFSGRQSSITVTFNGSAKRNINLLDIPIIKRNSDFDKKVPVGSGRFFVTQENGKNILKQNESYVLGTKFNIKTITLTDIPDMNTLFHTFNSGGVLACYIELNSSNQSYYGDIEQKEFTTNIISFLGINYSSPFLSNKNVRKALSYAINRQKLASEVLLSHAEPVWHPFNPKWSLIMGTELPKDKYSRDEAKKLLDEAGFLIGKSGKREIGNKPIEIRLLVSNENPFYVSVCKRLQEELSLLNITVNLYEKSFADYNNALNARDFDIYFASVKLPSNMDVNALTDPSVNKGGYDSAVLKKALTDFDNGTIGIDVAIQSFEDEMPFIPLYYKNNALAISRRIEGEITPLQDDLFKGIETWIVKDRK